MTTTTKTLAPLFTWRSAICESDLSPVVRHVALTLSLYMNERGGSAHPGAARLANETGLHISTVRQALSTLVAGEWLALVAQGGQRGERRIANAYEARVPVVLADPSSSPTRRAEQTDPSSSPRRPVVQDDPISPRTLQRVPPGGASAPPTDDSQHSTPQLVATYVDEYRTAHGGENPIRAWRDQAGHHARNLLAEGVPVADVRACLIALGKEGKSPAVIGHILGDLRRERAQANAS